MEESKNILSPTAGSVVVASGATLVGYYSFRSELLPVLAGILLFDIGYRISQLEKLCIPRSGDIDLNKDLLTGIVGLLGGSLLVSQGFITGAAATQNLRLYPMVTSGLLISSGYIIGHTLYINHFYGGSDQS